MKSWFWIRVVNGHLEYAAADAGADLGGEKFGEAGAGFARGKKDWGELGAGRSARGSIGSCRDGRNVRISLVGVAAGENIWTESPRRKTFSYFD